MNFLHYLQTGRIQIHDRIIQYRTLLSSDPDQWRFNTDPDPGIRYHWITEPDPDLDLLYSSVAFKIPYKKKILSLFGYLVLTEDTFTFVFKDNELLRSSKLYKSRFSNFFACFACWWKDPDQDK